MIAHCLTIEKTIKGKVTKWKDSKEEATKKEERWEFQSINTLAIPISFCFCSSYRLLNCFWYLLCCITSWNFGNKKAFRDLAIGENSLKSQSWQGTITWRHFGHIHNIFLYYNDLFDVHCSIPHSLFLYDIGICIHNNIRDG